MTQENIKLVHCSVCSESGTALMIRLVDGNRVCDKCLADEQKTGKARKGRK